jgi:uncharacterized membrane protein YhhN
MNRLFDKLPIIGKKIPGKITLSFLMLVFAILMHFVFKTFDRCICIVAMTFSFIGDVALNHNRDHSKQTNRDFILGGIAFIAAHVFYCMTYSGKIAMHGFETFNPGAEFAVIILLLITAMMFFGTIATKRSFKNKLFYFGLLYLWLTGINYVTIFSYSYSVKGIESIAAVGGLMFLASDVIIGMEKFLKLKSKVARELVWYLYPIGQLILITMA